MLHGAYRFALAFEATLVGQILDRLGANHQTKVVDPFCGTGTTLLESKIRNITSAGVDANPVCVVVSRAKTDWGISSGQVTRLARQAVQSASEKYRVHLIQYQKRRSRIYDYKADPLFEDSEAWKYLFSSGLIKRGWISRRPAVKTLLLADCLLSVPARQRSFLLLSLFGLLVPRISNMRFGPEIYRATRKTDCDVFGLFQSQVEENLNKLDALRQLEITARTRVRLGDSVNAGLDFLDSGWADIVLTSPPYLSDHDYSRLTRLELVFSGQVSSSCGLRKVKRRLLRSSSKNVYKEDSLGRLVKRFASITSVVKKIERVASERTSGFARVYPRLVQEYFGGMYRHFQKVSRVLAKGGYAAYVVGDQSSFFAIPIPTAKITIELAESCGAGLRLISIDPMKTYRGTRGAVTWTNQEWLVLLQKTGGS